MILIETKSLFYLKSLETLRLTLRIVGGAFVMDKTGEWAPTKAKLQPLLRKKKLRWATGLVMLRRQMWTKGFWKGLRRSWKVCRGLVIVFFWLWLRVLIETKSLSYLKIFRDASLNSKDSEGSNGNNSRTVIHITQKLLLTNNVVYVNFKSLKE